MVFSKRAFAVIILSVFMETPFFAHAETGEVSGKITFPRASVSAEYLIKFSENYTSPSPPWVFFDFPASYDILDRTKISVPFEDNGFDCFFHFDAFPVWKNAGKSLYGKCDPKNSAPYAATVQAYFTYQYQKGKEKNCVTDTLHLTIHVKEETLGPVSIHFPSKCRKPMLGPGIGRGDPQ